MKIQGNAVPSIDQSQAISPPNTSVKLLQKIETAKHGDVSTLASEGHNFPLPKGLTQQDAPEHALPKHTTPRLTALTEKDLATFKQKTAPSTDATGRDRGKQSLFSTPHTSIEIGESSAAATSHTTPATTNRGKQSLFSTPHTSIEIGESSATAASHTTPATTNRGKQSLFSTPYTSMESGETSASSPGLRAGKAPLFTPPHQLLEHGESSRTQAKAPDRRATAGNPSALRPPPATSADMPHQAAIEAPQLRLNAGKLDIGAQTSPHLATLLKATLGKASQSYISHESDQEGQIQRLIDKTGKVFQISTHPETGIIALHTSVPQNPMSRNRVTRNPSLDTNTLSLATGIHTDEQGQHWRIHDDKLYTKKASGSWQNTDQSLSKLTAQGDNKLYGLKDKQYIVNVATQQNSAPMGKEIHDYSIHQSGTTAVLLKSEEHEPSVLKFFPSMAAKGEQALEVTARYISDHLPERRGESPNLTAIGLMNDTLFAIDKENRVLTSPLPHGEQTDIGLTEVKQEALQTALGKDIQFEGFSHQRDGNLSLLVRDAQNQLHACPLSHPSLHNHLNNTVPDFKPGWNLSDTLHIDNDLGLNKVENHTIQLKNFDNQGTLGFLDHKIYAKNQHTGEWHEIAKDIDSLQRGQDGQAYALKNGELKKITLDHQTGNISYGENNIFSLTQAKQTLKLEEGPKGIPDDKKIAAAAIINTNRHVTLSTSGDLTFTNIRPDTEKTIHPDVPLHQHGIDGNIKQLGVDSNQKLYALTDKGKLFSLAAQDWQRPQGNKPTTLWQEETTPTQPAMLKNAQLDVTQDRKLTLTTATGETFTKADQQWESISAPQEPRSTEVRDRLFAELADASQMKKGPKGLRYATETQFDGMTTQPGATVSSKFSDRIRAHIFKPGFDVPRPAKVAANAVQHNWKGRDGLNTLYTQEKALFKTLESTNTQIKSNLSPRAPMDIKTRLDRLNLGTQGTALKKELESLRHDLEYSAEQQLIKLGKHQGVLNATGELNLNYKPSKLKNITQRFNPNRSGHSLSEELLTSWQHTPPSNESNAGQLLKAYKELKVNMSYQKTSIPMGRRRDPNDKMALVKARLVLDTLTLQKLDKLIEKAELVAADDPQQAPTKTQLASLQKDLSELKNDVYDKNPVKYYTDKGMESHHQVESSYDASKFFIKAFSKPDHSINLITRSALHAEDQEALNDKMKALLHGLKPLDAVSVTRSYASTASSVFLPSALQHTPLAVFPNGALNQNSSYVINFIGLEDGIEITMEKDQGKSARVGLGIARNILTDVAGKPQGHFNKKINDGKQTFTPDVNANASLSTTLGSADHTELRFSIKGNDIDQFVDELTHGNISPDTLVDKGMKHSAYHGHKFNFSIDAEASFQGRAGVDVFKHENTKPSTPSDGPDKKTTTTESYTVNARIGGGVAVKANLAKIANEKMSGREINGSRQKIVNNSGFLTSASASAELGLRVGASRVNNNGIFPFGVDLKASATASINNTISVEGELELEQAHPVTPKEIDTLIHELKSAFHDPASKKVLSQVKALPKVDSQLDTLSAHFDHINITNDKQHTARNSIRKMATQQLAASNHTEMMLNAGATIIHNNPHNLDKPGIVSFLTSLVSPTGRGTLDKQLHTMMEQDPTIASMLGQMHEKPNTYVAVGLELKDDVSHRLRQDVAAGKVTLDQVQKALQQPENRRIKSLTIAETGAYKEGFSSPVLFVGGSSSASLWIEKNAGTIAFKYGADPNTPRSYNLSGDITAKPELSTALKQLHSEGLTVHTP